MVKYVQKSLFFLSLYARSKNSPSSCLKEIKKDHNQIIDDQEKNRLKGQCHKNFCFRFFHESSSPSPLKITLGGSYRIFSKICRDICKSHQYQYQ
jgi:hypothetical protein